MIQITYENLSFSYERVAQNKLGVIPQSGHNCDLNTDSCGIQHLQKAQQQPCLVSV